MYVIATLMAVELTGKENRVEIQDAILEKALGGGGSNRTCSSLKGPIWYQEQCKDQ